LPPAQAINRAVCDGLAFDRRFIDWTHGSAFLHLLTHDPFDFPNYGSNQQHLKDLADLNAAVAAQLLISNPSSEGSVKDTDLTPAPTITSVDGTTLLPDHDVTVHGYGFAPNGNNVLLTMDGNPDIHYEFYDLESADGTTVTFTIPDWRPSRPDRYPELVVIGPAGFVFGMEKRKRLTFLLGPETGLFSGRGVFAVKYTVAPEENESLFHNWFTASVNQSDFRSVFERKWWRVSAEFSAAVASS